MTTHYWTVAPTVFELTPDHRQLVVRLAPDCSVVLDSPSVAMLLHTATIDAACAVPCRHAQFGTRLLGLHPEDRNWTDHPAGVPRPPGPLELYLHLPDKDIDTPYHGDSLALLRGTLAEVLQLLT